MDVLRRKAEAQMKISLAEDQRAALIAHSEYSIFLLLGWYKERGRTELCCIVDEDLIRAATLKEIEEFLCAA
jgi:hypothetical protein